MPNYTTYIDYKTAAERHLKTCQYLLSLYNTVATPDHRVHLLKNTYYLSGYVLECIFTYSICDLIGYDSTRNIRSVSDTTYNVFFHTPTFVSSNLCILSKHDLNMKMDFLRRNGGSTEIEDIPLVGSNVFISPTTRQLFTNWKPELRYKCEMALTLQEVDTFVQLVADVRRGILDDLTP